MNLFIDYDNIQSIQCVDRQSTQLEREGFCLVSTLRKGFNQFLLVYEVTI